MIMDAGYVPPEPSEGTIVIEVDPDLMDLVPMFLENRQTEIHEIRGAVASGDSAKVREIGHRMKGIGGGYGFDYVSVVGKALEDLAQAGNLSQVALWLGGLTDYLERVEPVEGPEED